jgi:MFS family permease
MARAGRTAAEGAAGAATGAATGIAGLWAGVREELLEGWHFLRGETVLLANTFQGVVGQFATGVLLALTPVYAQDVLERGNVDAVAAYAFLETGIGIGSLLGGFVIGLIGARLAKGRLVIYGYAAWGLCMFGLALAGNLPVAFAFMMGTGIANMIYIIPSQTLFQERTPAELIGRVVGFRFSLVFGSLTVALAVSGALAEIVGVTPVIALFGLVTTGAGLAGFLVPAVRDA